MSECFALETGPNVFFRTGTPPVSGFSTDSAQTRPLRIWFWHWLPRSGIYILVALVKAEASFKFGHMTSQSRWARGWISRYGSFHILHSDVGWGDLGFSILASRPCPAGHGIREHQTTFMITELSKAGDILLCLSRHETVHGSTRVEPSGAGMACWGHRAVYTGSHSSPAWPGEGGGGVATVWQALTISRTGFSVTLGGGSMNLATMEALDGWTSVPTTPVSSRFAWLSRNK